jgi:hypothetical protein
MEMNPIWISDFPLPPSVNEYLTPIRGRMIKTKVHRDFLQRCMIWSLRSKTTVDLAKDRFMTMKQEMERVQKYSAFRVDCFFAFHHSRVFTKNGLVKQLDADNRMKPAMDAIVKIFEIDDRLFFSGRCEKITTDFKEKECSLIRICPMTPKTLSEMKTQINQETIMAGFLSLG